MSKAEETDGGRPTTDELSSVVPRPSTSIRHRARKVGLVKFIIAALFFAVVLVNLATLLTVPLTVPDPPAPTATHPDAALT